MEKLWPLTYFTSKSKDELNNLIIDLYQQLILVIPAYEIEHKLISLIVDEFSSANLLSKYRIRVSDRLVKSIKETLKYPIDTEILIRYIQSILRGE